MAKARQSAAQGQCSLAACSPPGKVQATPLQPLPRNARQIPLPQPWRNPPPNPRAAWRPRPPRPWRQQRQRQRRLPPPRRQHTGPPPTHCSRLRDSGSKVRAPPHPPARPPRPHPRNHPSAAAPDQRGAHQSSTARSWGARRPPYSGAPRAPQSLQSTGHGAGWAARRVSLRSMHC